MRRSLAHLVSARPWAMLYPDPAWAAVRNLASGALVDVDEEGFARHIEAASFRERMGAVRVGSAEVIPVHGVISQRYTWLTWVLDGTALDWLREAIREAVADPDVSAIVLDVDSPGGSVDGMTEFAADLRAMREIKPIAAVANPIAASGGLYVASAASELVLTPSGMAGSVGVIMIHVDQSRALDEAGYTVTLITSGQYKGEGNPFEPLPDETHERLQVEGDHYYDLFLADVAKGRGTTAAAVRETYGQGRMLLPAEALSVGMIDRVDTLENTVRRLSKTRPAGKSAGRGVRIENRDADGNLLTPEQAIAAMAGDGSPDDSPEPEATADDSPPATAESTPSPTPDPQWVREHAAAFDRMREGAAPRWHD